MGIFTNVLGTILKEVVKKNKENPNVKTADPKVFEEVEKKIQTVESPSSDSRSRADVYKDYMEKIREAQRENEANPNVETADSSVFSDLLKEIERVNTRVEAPNAGQAPDLDFKTGPPSTNTSMGGVKAMTNSNGGKLQMRQNPEMGSPKLNVFIPELSLINVLDYSTNKIILDGKESRFALVEHEGQRGWILESYLNFN